MSRFAWRRCAAAVIAAVMVALGAGCTGKDAEERPSAPKPAPAKAVVVGVEPVEAAFLEQDSFNLALWVERGVKGRVLVRFSGFDGLAPVGEEELGRLRSIAGSGGTDDLWAAGDANNPGALYSASSFLYAAHRLGVIREVVWVVPAFARIKAEDLDGFRRFLGDKYPSRAAELDALKLGEDGVVRGTIWGVPVSLVCLEDLKAPSGPALVDIDLTFFAALYQDERQTSSLKFVAGMFGLMKDAKLRSDLVAVSASNADGKAPLRFRAFAGYYRQMLARPEMTSGKPPELWAERAQAWEAGQKDPELAIPIYKTIAKDYPDDAATRYDLAAAYFSVGELDACMRELDEAARLDGGYRAGFREFGDMLSSSGKDGDARRFYARLSAG